MTIRDDHIEMRCVGFRGSSGSPPGQHHVTRCYESTANTGCRESKAVLKNNNFRASSGPLSGGIHLGLVEAAVVMRHDRLSGLRRSSRNFREKQSLPSRPIICDSGTASPTPAQRLKRYRPTAAIGTHSSGVHGSGHSGIVQTRHFTPGRRSSPGGVVSNSKACNKHRTPSRVKYGHPVSGCAARGMSCRRLVTIIQPVCGWSGQRK